MVRFLYDRHGFLDLLLSGFITLRFRFHDRLRRVVHVQSVATELRTMHLQPSYNTLLLAEFQQREPRSLILRIPGVLDLAAQLEVIHQLL